MNTHYFMMRTTTTDGGRAPQGGARRGHRRVRRRLHGASTRRSPARAASRSRISSASSARRRSSTSPPPSAHVDTLYESSRARPRQVRQGGAAGDGRGLRSWSDRDRLLLQLQVLGLVRRPGYPRGRPRRLARARRARRARSGESPEVVAAFFAKGVLLNDPDGDGRVRRARAVGGPARGGLPGGMPSEAVFFLDLKKVISHNTREGVEEMTPSTTLWTFAITSIALFMVTLDNLVVTTAIPVIRSDLHASLRASSGRSTPTRSPSPCCSSRARRSATASAAGASSRSASALFTLGSVAAALAPTVEALNVARAVQGLGGAIVTPLTLTILSRGGAGREARRRARRLGRDRRSRGRLRARRRRRRRAGHLVAVDLLAQRADRDRCSSRSR